MRVAQLAHRSAPHEFLTRYSSVAGNHYRGAGAAEFWQIARSGDLDLQSVVLAADDPVIAIGDELFYSVKAVVCSIAPALLQYKALITPIVIRVAPMGS